MNCMIIARAAVLIKGSVTTKLGEMQSSLANKILVKSSLLYLLFYCSFHSDSMICMYK
jgi:hypothetical protein